MWNEIQLYYLRIKTNLIGLSWKRFVCFKKGHIIVNGNMVTSALECNRCGKGFETPVIFHEDIK